MESTELPHELVVEVFLKGELSCTSLWHQNWSGIKKAKQRKCFKKEKVLKSITCMEESDGSNNIEIIGNLDNSYFIRGVEAVARWRCEGGNLRGGSRGIMLRLPFAKSGYKEK